MSPTLVDLSACLLAIPTRDILPSYPADFPFSPPLWAASGNQLSSASLLAAHVFAFRSVSPTLPPTSVPMDLSAPTSASPPHPDYPSPDDAAGDSVAAIDPDDHSAPTHSPLRRWSSFTQDSPMAKPV